MTHVSKIGADFRPRVSSALDPMYRRQHIDRFGEASD